MLLEEKLLDLGGDRLIRLKAEGDYRKANRYFERLLEIIKLGTLDKYGKMGVDALRDATPKATGKTSESWSYNIVRKRNSVSIVFSNDNVNEGVHVAIVIQYGHATPSGGYVQGRDYINPAIRPVFDEMANNAWKEITDL